MQRPKSAGLLSTESKIIDEKQFQYYRKQIKARRHFLAEDEPKQNNDRRLTETINRGPSFLNAKGVFDPKLDQSLFSSHRKLKPCQAVDNIFFQQLTTKINKMKAQSRDIENLLRQVQPVKVPDGKMLLTRINSALLKNKMVRRPSYQSLFKRHNKSIRQSQ